MRDFFRKLVFTPKKREFFYHSLKFMVQSGKSIDGAIDDMANEYKANATWIQDESKFYINLRNRAIDGVMDFDEAIAPYIPDNEYLILATARKDSESQARALQAAEEMAIQRSEIQSMVISSVKKALTSFIFIMGMIVFTSVYMVPKLNSAGFDSIAGDMLKAFIDTNMIITNYGVYILAGFLVLLGFGLWSLPRMTNVVRRKFLDYIPPISAYKAYLSIVFLTSFGQMLRSDTSKITEIYEDMLKIKNNYLKHYVKHSLNLDINENATEGESLDNGLFNMSTKIKIKILANDKKLVEGMPALIEEAKKYQMNTIRTTFDLITVFFEAGLGLYLIWFTIAMMDIHPGGM